MTARPRAAERGMVLMVSLTLLLALTLGAVSAAQTTVLELRMTRNGADAALAFRAAEAALLEGEHAVEAGPVSGMLTAQAYGEDPAWQAHGWPDAQSAYAVESVATLPSPSAPEVEVYRITARGRGPNGAVVWLQTTYGVAASPGASPEMLGRLSWVSLPWPPW